MPRTILKIAAAQYPIDYLPDWQSFENKIARWVTDAARDGARLLVFPEYGSMELASLFGRDVCADLALQIERMQELLPQFIALHGELAKRHGVHLVASSFPVRSSGGYVNRAHIFSPSGTTGYQDKLIMTRFENEQWHISAGETAKVFETTFGRVAINVCYDAEFPLIARSQAEAGAHMILVPSCTDTIAGYHRVRVGCQARALENQCIVVQAPLVGTADWSEAVDVNVGAAGVFVPPDRGFPSDGVIALGTLNDSQWLYAEIDLSAVESVRNEGQVFNYRDWPRQWAKVDDSVPALILPLS